MTVDFTLDFLDRLSEQIEFIAQDKPEAAQKFKDDLFRLLADIPKMPMKNRKSIYFEKNTIRDLIYKGYTIIYEIDEASDQIKVFCLLKYKEKP